MAKREHNEFSRLRTAFFFRGDPHRVSGNSHTLTEASTRQTRYVEKGVQLSSDPNASVLEAREFSQGGKDRVALMIFPSPTASDIRDLAEAWHLHPLLVEDLQLAGQRPKIERYGEVLFMVVRAAKYDDAAEDVYFSEFHVLMCPGAVAVLCQDNRWIDGTDGAMATGAPVDVARRAERDLLGDMDLLKLGPEAVIYRLLDAIVDGFAPVLRGLAIDKEQIERQVFSGDSAVAERIYRLSQEVIDLQHTTSSMKDVLSALQRGFHRYSVPESLQAYWQDVTDHLDYAAIRVAELREALSQVLSVNATLVAQRQNEDMKKISGWAAIIFAPTLIGSIYGMNFDNMPELHWTYGYPLSLAAMVGLGILLYIIFRKKKWM